MRHTKIDMLHPCLICGKRYGVHAFTDQGCPKGMKARIGYVSYGPSKFEPLPGWTVKEGTFIL